MYGIVPVQKVQMVAELQIAQAFTALGDMALRVHHPPAHLSIGGVTDFRSAIGKLDDRFAPQQRSSVLKGKHGHDGDSFYNCTVYGNRTH